MRAWTAGFKTLLIAMVLPLALAGCGINTIPTKDEAAKAAWGEVQNQYQRRSDLVPNLVATVQGYAQQEKSVLVQVTHLVARAQATHVSVDASTVSDPAKFAQYQQAQNQLSGVLGHLLSITENYPDLKSNQNFLALQSQLEGTENRIAIARRDYNTAVQGLQYRDPHLPRRAVGGDPLQVVGQADAVLFRHHRSAVDRAQGELRPAARRRAAIRSRTSRRASGPVTVVVRAWLLVLAFAGTMLGAHPAAAAPSFPPLTGRVVDNAHVLSPQVKADLNAKLQALEQKNGDQLVVVTLPSLQGLEIEDYGYQLGRAWGIGQKGKSNGALFIVAPSEHKVRIEVGWAAWSRC